jgi:hypothetical protein
VSGALDPRSVNSGSIEMEKDDWWSHALKRPGAPRRMPVRWTQLGKAMVGFGAILALMSALLYADVWLRQEQVMSTTTVSAD